MQNNNRKVFNLPNTLTTLRIFMIPVFVATIMYDRFGFALLVFVTAAVTDFLDGLIARWMDQKTVLGTFLDPLADKFLIVSTFVLFSHHGLLPDWLTITVISRDIIVMTGWVLLFLVTRETTVEPMTSGKLAVALELVLVCYVLLLKNFDYKFLELLMAPLVWVTAGMAIFSGLQYISQGFRRAGEK